MPNHTLKMLSLIVVMAILAGCSSVIIPKPRPEPTPEKTWDKALYLDAQGFLHYKTPDGMEKRTPDDFEQQLILWIQEKDFGGGLVDHDALRAKGGSSLTIQVWTDENAGIDQMRPLLAVFKRNEVNSIQISAAKPVWE